MQISNHPIFEAFNNVLINTIIWNPKKYAKLKFNEEVICKKNIIYKIAY